MKIIKLLILSSLLVGNICQAQEEPLVKNISEVYKLKDNECLFIQRPLKILLDAIEPKIKRMIANAKGNGEGFFILTFVDNETYWQYRAQNKIPTGIIVYVKEKFEWDPRTKRPLGYNWSKSDIEQYGNLTVIGFRITQQN